MLTLRDRLPSWTDLDFVEFHIAVLLGIMPDGADSYHKHKWVFWTNNELEHRLGGVLRKLVAEGFLEENDEQQYRWKQSESKAVTDP